jgi:ATP-binding cassette subfamily A (ABC1) protein 6
MGLFSYLARNIQVLEVPPQDLGSLNEFNGSSLVVVYTPISNITQQIMNKTTFAPTMKGKYTIEKKQLVSLVYSV